MGCGRNLYILYTPSRILLFRLSFKRNGQLSIIVERTQKKKQEQNEQDDRKK